VNESSDTATHLNDAVLVNIVEHLVHHGGDSFFRTTGDGQSDGGGVEVTGKGLGGQDRFSLEEVPFSFVFDEGHEISDGMDSPSASSEKI
jgi:hypothetical protein